MSVQTDFHEVSHEQMHARDENCGKLTMSGAVINQIFDPEILQQFAGVMEKQISQHGYRRLRDGPLSINEKSLLEYLYRGDHIAAACYCVLLWTEGGGYRISQPEHLDFLRGFARSTGLYARYHQGTAEMLKEPWNHPWACFPDETHVLKLRTFSDALQLRMIELQPHLHLVGDSSLPTIISYLQRQLLFALYSARLMDVAIYCGLLWSLHAPIPREPVKGFDAEVLKLFNEGFNEG